MRGYIWTYSPIYADGYDTDYQLTAHEAQTFAHAHGVKEFARLDAFCLSYHGSVTLYELEAGEE